MNAGVAMCQDVIQPVLVIVLLFGHYYNLTIIAIDYPYELPERVMPVPENNSW